MKVIAQIDNLSYYEGKVHELIAEAGRVKLEDGDMVAYKDSLMKAIQVLTLCIATADNMKP